MLTSANYLLNICWKIYKESLHELLENILVIVTTQYI